MLMKKNYALDRNHRHHPHHRVSVLNDSWNRRDYSPSVLLEI
ncbi:unnamed protein product [Trichobilharzia regenti]|nr:unnamed protein product [Trichobilharzia regenti]